MENIGVGAGMAALAFWGFVAVAVVAGIWDNIRKREAQHETLRRLVESGQTIDRELTDKLIALGDGGSKRPDMEFKITALWILPTSVGLAALALVLGSQVPEALIPIMAAAALTACLGIGFYLASIIAGRWYKDNGDSSIDR